MISRRAQLKSQDQKVSSSLTDDFTMRSFIAVSQLLHTFPPFDDLSLFFRTQVSCKTRRMSL